jgi:hypothetical protein
MFSFISLAKVEEKDIEGNEQTSSHREKADTDEEKECGTKRKYPLACIL